MNDGTTISDAFLNNTEMPATYNYMKPDVSDIVNGENDPESQRFYVHRL